MRQQLALIESPVPSYAGQRVLIGLSGGINSMAVLCWLAGLPKGNHPAELHLFYAHFREHSPDTFKFVRAGIEYARNRFDCPVKVKITRNSVISFFRQQKMIPHPTESPCSRMLKIEPILEYYRVNGIGVDLVGYIKTERFRKQRMESRSKKTPGFPIIDWSDADCFEIVDREIGWHPAIYDVKVAGKRLFKHNNCLPCKNMEGHNLKDVKRYYPDYWAKAQELSDELGKYWGREVPKMLACNSCLDFGEDA